MKLLPKLALPLASLIVLAGSAPCLAMPVGKAPLLSLAATDIAIERMSDASATDTSGGTSGSTTSEQNAGNQGALKPTTLQGGVAHAETLPGLSAGLKVGRVYSDDLFDLESSPSNNDWFYVPKWYAGVRHSEYALIISRYDYDTEETTSPMLKQLNRQDARAGYQVDANGGIWDYKKVPMIQHVEADTCDAVLYLRALTPISGSDDRLVIKYNEISVSIDKRTKKILQIVQQEQINTVTSPTPGTLRVDISVKSFDADGQPQRQEQSVMITKIVKPFEKIDQLNGQDLRPLFRDYLISHHLEKLVPPDLAKASP